MELSSTEQTELNRRIRCFFLSGVHNRDAYIHLFNGLFPEEGGRYAYLPLFLLRRDIFLFLRFDHFCGDLKVDHSAHFPALLLADIITEGLVFNITAEMQVKNRLTRILNHFLKNTSHLAIMSG